MKNIILCSRCGQAEKRGQVFESVFDFHLCKDCSQLAYRAKLAKAQGDELQYHALAQDFQEGIVESPKKDQVAALIS